MKNWRHWCPSLWGRLSKWSNISNWKSRICFRQCIGIRTISLLLGLLRQSGVRPSWQTWLSVLCWTSSFYGNRGMPRDGSERGSWQVDQAMWILYDIDVEQVSGMNLKLSSAKRVETEGLICQLIICLFLCGCARQNAGRWHGLAFYAERHAFTEIVRCQEVGLKGFLTGRPRCANSVWYWCLAS